MGGGDATGGGDAAPASFCRSSIQAQAHALSGQKCELKTKDFTKWQCLFTLPPVVPRGPGPPPKPLRMSPISRHFRQVNGQKKKKKRWHLTVVICISWESFSTDKCPSVHPSAPRLCKGKGEGPCLPRSLRRPQHPRGPSKREPNGCTKNRGNRAPGRECITRPGPLGPAVGVECQPQRPQGGVAPAPRQTRAAGCSGRRPWAVCSSGRHGQGAPGSHGCRGLQGW